MNEAMQKLIDAVQKASPVVWQAAYRQVWVDGIENVVLLMACLIGGKLMWKFARKLADDDADEVVVFFAHMGAVVLFLLSIPFFVCGLDCFANPTYAAIKNLKGLL